MCDEENCIYPRVCAFGFFSLAGVCVCDRRVTHLRGDGRVGNLGVVEFPAVLALDRGPRRIGHDVPLETHLGEVDRVHAAHVEPGVRLGARRDRQFYSATQIESLINENQ